MLRPKPVTKQLLYFSIGYSSNNFPLAELIAGTTNQGLEVIIVPQPILYCKFIQSVILYCNKNLKIEPCNL